MNKILTDENKIFKNIWCCLNVLKKQSGDSKKYVDELSRCSRIESQILV